MVCKGTVKNGVIVLDEGAAIKEGTRVEILTAKPGPFSPDFLEMIGMFDGPPDFSVNHDHYIHGTPKHE